MSRLASAVASASNTRVMTAAFIAAATFGTASIAKIFAASMLSKSSHVRLPDDEGTPIFRAAHEAALREKTRPCKLRQ